MTRGELATAVHRAFPNVPARFVALAMEMLGVHDKKAADYGRIDSKDANLYSSEKFGIPAWVGVAMRMQDKMHRIQKFVRDKNLVNESVDDSFMDLANYSLLALFLYQGGGSPSPTAKPGINEGVVVSGGPTHPATWGGKVLPRECTDPKEYD